MKFKLPFALNKSVQNKHCIHHFHSHPHRPFFFFLSLNQPTILFALCRRCCSWLLGTWRWMWWLNRYWTMKTQMNETQIFYLISVRFSLFHLSFFSFSFCISIDRIFFQLSSSLPILVQFQQTPNRDSWKNH